VTIPGWKADKACCQLRQLAFGHDEFIGAAKPSGTAHDAVASENRNADQEEVEKRFAEYSPQACHRPSS